jgi:hypothetical protein
MLLLKYLVDISRVSVKYRPLVNIVLLAISNIKQLILGTGVGLRQVLIREEISLDGLKVIVERSH